MRTAISLIMLLALAASTVPTNANGASPCKVDLTFVMDISSSIPDADWPTVKYFFSNLTARFTISQSLARIGIVTFSGTATRRIQLKGCADAACINNDLDLISHATSGATATAAALKEAANGYTVGNGDRPGVPNVVVLFTDGSPNVNVPETIPAAEALKSTKNVKLFVVAIGDDLNEDRLKALPTGPDTLLRIVDGDFSKLLGLVDPIAVRACPLPKCLCSNLRTTPPPTTITPTTASN